MITVFTQNDDLKNHSAQLGINDYLLMFQLETDHVIYDTKKLNQM